MATRYTPLQIPQTKILTTDIDPIHIATPSLEEKRSSSTSYLPYSPTLSRQKTDEMKPYITCAKSLLFL